MAGLPGLPTFFPATIGPARMEKHLRTAGFLNIAAGVFGIVVCAILLIFFRGPGGILLMNAREGGAATTPEGIFTAAYMVFLLVMAGPLIAVGNGLLKFQETARNVGMVLSIFALAHVPFGSIAAVYNFWVLTSFEVEPLFRREPPRKNKKRRR